MNTITGIIEYTCEKGTLWRDKKGYHWTSAKDGDDGCWITEKIVTLKPTLAKFDMAIYSNTATILNVVDTVLMGCKDTGSWEEVDYTIIIGGDTTPEIYTGKNNTGLALLINNEDHRAIDLIALLSDIARNGIYKEYELLPKLNCMTWLEGHANWQGKPISKTQELKLKMMGCWDSEPYKNYKAARLEIGDKKVIEVYNYISALGNWWTPERCNNKYKFYTINKEIT